MRLAFVVSRFGSPEPSAPEILAREFVERAPGHWRATVLTTGTAGGAADGAPAEARTPQLRIRRFPTAGDAGRPEERTSPELLKHLEERGPDYDLVVVFGVDSPVCREAVGIVEGRTVLLPFADEETVESDLDEVFAGAAAFVFGSDAEERLVLRRFTVHRRMRETVRFAAMLPSVAEPEAFRRRSGSTGAHLVHPGRLEPGRGAEELLRYFVTFRERLPEAHLELVLFGPSRIATPRRSDIRLLVPKSGQERRDAVASALAAVVPAKLADASAATEPFRLGVPLVATASAENLVNTLKASNGGLFYQNYDEFELILRRGLQEPDLFRRMGAAGQRHLTSNNDWNAVISRCDRVLRSFARPTLGDPPDAQPATAAAPDDSVGDEHAGEVPAQAPPDAGESPDAAPQPEDAGPAGVEEAAQATSDGGEPEETGGPAPEAEESGSQAPEEEGAEPALPGFFGSSIR